MDLQILSRERKPCFFELSLTGRLDTTTHKQLEQMVELLLANPIQGLVLDLAQLDYISSMGLRVIFQAMKDLKARGAEFMMTNMQPQIKRIFEIANIVPESSVFTSVEEADRYYEMIQDRIKKGKPA